jgi:hypothetical protein
MDAKIKWNPVKNGYPEKHRGFYLVTVGIGMPEPIVSIVEWIKPEDGEGAFYLYNSQYKLTDLGFCVKAWAKLPKPWMEGGRRWKISRKY